MEGPGISHLRHRDEFLDGATHALEDLKGFRRSVHIGRGGDNFVCPINDNMLDRAREVFSSGFFQLLSRCFILADDDIHTFIAKG